MLRRLLPLLLGLLLVGAGALGCKPQVGDSCKLSTDCSVSGDRLCDTSQPDGYCTIFNCEPDTCPGESICVEFHPSSSRLKRRFCLASCVANADCRPGYACTHLTVWPDAPTPDRDALIIDTNPSRTGICLP
jgi:hypothetical protein